MALYQKQHHQHQTIRLQTIKYLQYSIREEETKEILDEDGRKQAMLPCTAHIHLLQIDRCTCTVLCCFVSWKMDLMPTELTCSQTSVLWSIDQVDERNSLGFSAHLLHSSLSTECFCFIQLVMPFGTSGEWCGRFVCGSDNFFDS